MILWGHSIYQKKHIKQFAGAQRGTLSLIHRTMKSTPLEAIESEMEIIPKSRLISKPQNKKL